MLDLIAVPFKRKMASVYLQELFDERINSCLIKRSSLGVFFPGRPDLFQSGNVPSVLNLTKALGTAVLE